MRGIVDIQDRMPKGLLSESRPAHIICIVYGKFYDLFVNC